jgi:hypothetical protein
MSMTFYATSQTVKADGTVQFLMLGGPDVNLCNRNARMILELLGYEAEAEDGCGSILASRLVERVEQALAVTASVPEIDCGTETEEGIGLGGARWIECGVREGYVRDTLERILEVARAAGDDYVSVA